MEPYEYLAKVLDKVDQACQSKPIVVLEHCGFCGRYEPIVERLWNVPACDACRAMVYDDQDPKGGGCAP